MEVELVRWPEERGRRDELRRCGRPRLLVLDGAAPAPSGLDLLEDWIRLPAADSDVAARVAALELRASSLQLAGGAGQPPTLDDDGVLRVNGRWVPLPPVEARLTAALLDRFGAVVSRDSLARAGWPDGAPGRNALDVHVLRLRRRVEPLSLVIRTVRSRGYVLEPAPPGGANARSDSGQAGVSEA